MQVPNPLLLIAELTVQVPAALSVLLEPDRRSAPASTSDELPDRGLAARLPRSRRPRRAAAGADRRRADGAQGDRRAGHRPRPRRASTRPSSPRRCRSRASGASKRSTRPGSTTSRSASRTPTRSLADEIAGTIAFDRKMKAAALARELDFPLTINVVLHRRNLDRIESIIAMAEDLGARRVELANTQYHGWATINRDALMPTRAQLEHGEAVVIARTRAARAEDGDPLGAARLLRGGAEAVHGRLGARRDPRAAERRRAALPGGGLDPRPEVRERARQAARGDLVRVGGVQRLPRHRLDAGALPHLPARPPARGLRRLPLPGAGADRRRDGDRPGLPVLPAPPT